jgi:hypothetical protein
LQGFGNSILEAKNKLAFKAILYISFLFLGVILGAFLARSYGALGMISGTVTGWLIVQNVMNFYYNNTIGLNIIRFFKEIFHKTFFTVILLVGIGYLINLIPGYGWINFILKASLYTIIYFPVMYVLGMIKYEKELFLKPLQTIVVKLGKK